MAKSVNRLFYIGLYKKGGRVIGHGVSSTPDFLLTSSPSPNEPESAPQDTAGEKFENVLSSFVSVMESYRSFIPLTLSIAPYLSMVIADDRVGGFARSKGIERADLSTPDVTIYELEFSQYRDFIIRRDEVTAAGLGARHLPEIAVVGLISAYDAFLANLLRAIARKQPGVFLTSDKTLKFSDLTNFSSMEEARSYLIDKEVESVIRLSHHEQFDWMQKRFDIKLREDLPVWPKFVELCERRNLLTHTGGVVSRQYLELCEQHYCDVGDVKVGDKLKVDAEYFRGR